MFHYEVDPDRFASEIERDLLDRVHYVREATQLPVAAKLIPEFTCLANFCCRVAGAGAKSVCLFGQAPVVEPRYGDELESHWRLTNHADLRVTLDAVHRVRRSNRKLTIAASGGIQNPDDALAAIQLGADVLMLTSAIYRQGSGLIEQICDSIRNEMSRHRMDTFRELVGLALRGYDAFPERTRRQQYANQVTDLSTDRSLECD